LAIGLTFSVRFHEGDRAGGVGGSHPAELRVPVGTSLTVGPAILRALCSKPRSACHVGVFARIDRRTVPVLI
jgi:hypothetical protein